MMLLDRFSRALPTPIVSIQNRYDPSADRTHLSDLCDQEEIAFLPWAPIQDLDRLPKLMDIAERHGATG